MALKALSSIGHALAVVGKDIFLVTEKAAPLVKFAGVVLAMRYPGLGTAIEGAANLVVQTEVQAAQAGVQQGTGEQKAAAVLNVVGNSIDQELQSLGLAKDGTNATNVITDIVNVMNVDPNLFTELEALFHPLTATNTAQAPSPAQAKAAAPAENATKSQTATKLPGSTYTIPTRQA